MLIKFTSGGRGGGGTIAQYLTAPDREGRDHAPPEVLRGDMDRTRDLIDSIDRKWSYTHGVVSFALEDAPTEDQQRLVMDELEALAFAGLDPEQYDITWVRHQHTEGGRVELHFVTPRLELTTGKALNIAPPGWESSYRPLRDFLNHSHGWARPDDPERARELHSVPVRDLEGFSLREGREALHGLLTDLVGAGLIQDRAGMVAALEDAGMTIPRQGKDYITVQDPETEERFRLKGRIYEKDWTYDAELDRAAASATRRADGRDRGPDLGRAEEARRELDARIGSRADFHARRYPRHEREMDLSAGDRERHRALVVGGADRDLADGGGLMGLALTVQPDPAPGDRAISEVLVRGPDLSDTARGDGSDDLPQRRTSHALRGPADGVEHGPADPLRARLARTVRDIGERVRGLAEGLKGYGERLAGLLREGWGPDTADRGATERFDRALAGLGDSLDRADATNEGLGRCREQVAGHTEELEREIARTAQRDRGWDYGL